MNYFRFPFASETSKNTTRGSYVYKSQRNAMGTGTHGVSPVASALADVSKLRAMEAALDQVITNGQGDDYAVADWRGCVRVARIDMGKLLKSDRV